MLVHTYLLCMGSNQEGERHLAAAVAALRAHFGTLHCGERIRTVAEGTASGGYYNNQALRMWTTATPEEVLLFCKQLEKENGRTPAGKAAGYVPLDIDLLVADGCVLRPEDMQKEYVQAALATLS